MSGIYINNNSRPLERPIVCAFAKIIHRTTQNTAYGVIGPVEENSARARGGQTSGKHIDPAATYTFI